MSEYYLGQALPVPSEVAVPDPLLDDPFATLVVERRGPVVVITMNREHVLNAYNRKMTDELRTVWRAYRDDEQARVAVITGAGAVSFSTGFDVDDTLSAEVSSPSLDADGRVALTARDLRVYKPVIAAVNGYCCAGGWHFVNDADVVLCSATATFFDTHVDVGLANPVEAVGLMSRLPIGEVFRMVLSGRDYRLTAERALQLGLVTEVTSPDALLERAVAMGEVIAQHPSDILSGSLETMWRAIDTQRAEAEQLGLLILSRSDATAAGRERLRAFRPGRDAETEA
jgi:E-phenylitaconyl-CoA hydratase